MRPLRSAALFATLSLAGTVALFGQVVHSPQPALAAVAVDTYSWQNVRIDGGGFVRADGSEPARVLACMPVEEQSDLDKGIQRALAPA